MEEWKARILPYGEVFASFERMLAEMVRRCDVGELLVLREACERVDISAEHEIYEVAPILRGIINTELRGRASVRP